MPTPGSGSGKSQEFADAIEGACTEIQERACLPHVLAQLLIEEYGAGNVEKPVLWELELPESKARLRDLGNVYELMNGDPNGLLGPGETDFTGMSAYPQLVGVQPDIEKGVVKAKFLGRF